MKKNTRLFFNSYVSLFVIFFFVQQAYAQWVPVTSPTTNQLQSIVFANPTTGFAGGAEGTYKTTDGGTTWTKLPYHGIDSIWLEAINIQHLKIVDEFTFYIAGWNALDNAAVIIKTTDGGLNWIKQYSGAFDSRLNDIYFTSANVGYVVGDKGKLLKTTNGGTQWLQATSGTTEALSAIFFPTGKTGYVGGENVILKTTNAGLNWSRKELPYNITSLFFTDSLTGYAGTLNGDILKTTNGADTWTLYHTFDNIPFYAIRFINDSTGYACASNGNGQLYKTTSFGKYWELQPSSTGKGLLSCFFTTTNIGFAVGEDGRIIKTTNAGGLTAPNANFTAPTVFCADSLLLFKNNGPSNYTYEWRDNGTSPVNSYSLTKNFIADSKHTISLIATNNGYSDTASYAFTVASSLAIHVKTLVSNDSICLNSETTISILNSETDVSYTLKNGNNDIGAPQNGTGATLSFQTGSVSTTTTFTIQAVKSNSCSTNKVLHPETIYVFPPIQQNLIVSAVRPVICVNDSTTIEIHSSQTGIHYQLVTSGNNTGKPIAGTGGTIALPTGMLTNTSDYRIRATNNGGCEVMLDPTITITVQSLTVEFSANHSSVFVNDTVGFTNTSNANTYAWAFGANSIPASATGVDPGKIIYTAAGKSVIMLIGTTQAGCKDTAYTTVSVFNKANSFNGIYCGNTALYTAPSSFPYFDRIRTTHMDRFGNLYLAAFSYSFARWPNTVNMSIHCYGKNGMLRWSNIQVPPNTGNWTDYISTHTNAISSDENGNVYLAGSYAAPDFTFGNVKTNTVTNDQSTKGFLLKLDSTGTAQWIINGYNSVAGMPTSIVTGSDVLVDAKNDIYFSVYRNSPHLVFQFPDGKLLDLSADTAEMYVLKIRQDGSLITYYSSGSRVMSLFNPNNSTNNPTEQPAIYPKMQLGSCNELFIHAKKYYFNGSGFSRTVIGTISRIDPIKGWDKEFVAFSLKSPYWLDLNASITCINPFVMDNSGNFYLTTKAGEQAYIGNDTITTSDGSTILAKYDPSGKLLWYHVYANTEFSDLVVNNEQNLFFLGKYKNLGDFYSVHTPPSGLPNKGNSDVAIGEYSKDGDLLWVNQVAGVEADNAYRFAKNSCDELFFTMRTNNSVIGTDSITADKNILVRFSKSACGQHAPSSAFSFIKNGNTCIFTNNSTDATGYFWDFGDGHVSTDKSPTHTFAVSGNYLISLKVTNGSCSDFKCIASDKDVITSVTEETHPSILIYPNPNNGVFHIRMNEEKGEATVFIYDVCGKQVYKKADLSLSPDTGLEINLEKLPKGIYELNCISEKENLHAPIIIQ